MEDVHGAKGMVDGTRRAFDELEPPACPSCHIDMKWTRSTLVARDTINHVFQCPSCSRPGETTSKIEVVVVVPPDKLSAPFFMRAA
jgi:hypothetical protein